MTACKIRKYINTYKDINIYIDCIEVYKEMQVYKYLKIGFQNLDSSSSHVFRLRMVDKSLSRYIFVCIDYTWPVHHSVLYIAFTCVDSMVRTYRYLLTSCNSEFQFALPACFYMCIPNIYLYTLPVLLLFMQKPFSLCF